MYSFALCTFISLIKEPVSSEMTEFCFWLVQQVSNLPDTQGGHLLYVVQHISRIKQNKKAVLTSLSCSIESGPKSQIEIGKNLWTEAGLPQNYRFVIFHFSVHKMEIKPNEFY